MKTLAVMCIALTSTRPSRTPLSRIAASTSGVMLTNARRVFVWTVRTLRWVFMVGIRLEG